MNQFAQLSLGQDLRDKDALLYRSTATIARGGTEGIGELAVDRASRGVYVEAIRSSRAGQELKGRESHGAGPGVKVDGAGGLVGGEEK